MARPGRTPDSPFWVEPAEVDLAARRLRLGPEESHHLLRVFRAAPGTIFEAVDGRGSLYRCALEEGDARAAVGRIESRTENAGELPVSFALLAGLPDPGQAESLVEHAVPLGATSIDFVAATRSGRGPLAPARLERLLRIARSALKQSRRTRMPSLRSSEGLEAALEAPGAIPGPVARLVADPGGSSAIALPLRANPWVQPTIIMAVGPPGGFLDAETELLRSRGFEPISLGTNRLSTSTAAIALLAAVRNLMLASGLGRVDKNGLSGYLL